MKKHSPFLKQPRSPWGSRRYVLVLAPALGACAAQGTGEARLPAPVMGEVAAGTGSTTAPAPDSAGVGRPSEAPDGSTLPGLSAPMPLGSECVSTGTIEASLPPANLAFLIDRSGSMGCNLPPITDSATCEADPVRADPSAPSKWEVVRRALEAVLAELPASARASITYFSNDDHCGVQSSPHVPMARLEDAQRAALAQSLAGVELRGGTPLVGGLILAYKQLNPDQTPSQPHGPRFVVLLTDGQEGCAPQETTRLLEQELPKSRRARITTFVVGVPGSEVARGFLSRLAFAGGAPRSGDCDHTSPDPLAGDCHFDMTRESDLAAQLRRALMAITQTALGCEFVLPQPPAGVGLDYSRVNVVFRPSAGEEELLLPQDPDLPCEEGANGWQYTDDRSRVRLCGEACERVQRAASIRIALGCQSIRVD